MTYKTLYQSLYQPRLRKDITGMVDKTPTENAIADALDATVVDITTGKPSVELRHLSEVEAELQTHEGSWFTADDVVSIATWEDAISLLAETEGIEVAYADEVIGDGFTIASREDKDKLCGSPLIFLEWRFNDGTFGKFVSARVIQKTGENPEDIKKWILNDGSVGVLRDLAAYSVKTHKTTGLIVRNGLKRSDYTYTDEKTGKEIPASTYYLDTTP